MPKRLPEPRAGRAALMIRIAGIGRRARLLSAALACMSALPAPGAAGPGPSAQTFSSGGEECIVTASVCVEPGGTRIVDGIAVTRDCWATRDTYACLAPVEAGGEGEDSTDGCATLAAEAAGDNAARCSRTEALCAEEVTGIDGERICVQEKENWACEQKIELPPA